MTDAGPAIARRLSITGLVQGVGYRDAMCREARSLGLDGWVRNRRDGAVEALIQGAPAAVGRMVDWARRGPPAARVREVDVAEAPAMEVSGFAIRPTE